MSTKYVLTKLFKSKIFLPQNYENKCLLSHSCIQFLSTETTSCNGSKQDGREYQNSYTTYRTGNKNTLLFSVVHWLLMKAKMIQKLKYQDQEEEGYANKRSKKEIKKKNSEKLNLTG